MNRHARRAEAGFSFIELLVTIIIAGIAFAAMVPVFVQAQKVTAGDKARAVAFQVAQDRIEKLRQLDFELITTENLNSNSYFIGDSPNTWTEQTEGGGTKTFNLAYTVTDRPVSGTDARIAYKVVTVRASWEGPPLPHKDVVLTTMIYRQYSGPALVDFTVAPANLALSDPLDPSSERLIVNSPVSLRAVVNSADLDSMAPRTVGVAPNQRTLEGRVDFLVTSSTGTAYPTISVPYSSAALPAFSTTWTIPGLTAGAGDGYYTFKAVAFSTMKSPGNSWDLTYRIETGPPAAVTDLSGTAGLTSASLTWTASTTGDVDHYVVRRDGTTIATLPKAAGSMGYIDDGLTGAAGVTYAYSVCAVDWKGNESTAASISLVSVDPATVAPAPASDLRGQAVDSKARLTWVASPTAGVLGYQVYQTIGATTTTFTTATATMDVPQGWGTTALYQVKPFVAGNVPSLAYSTILLGQPQQIVGAVPWLVVTVGPEVRYTLVIQNTTKRVLTSLKLFYLGPGGMDAQQEILPAGALVGKGATHTWANLAAGRYRWDWVETSTGKTGSQTAWCTGATLTIYGYTP